MVAKIKTRPTDENVTEFLDSVADERRRAEGHELRSLFERITGERAVMWGPSMVGFGSRPYTNTIGTNDWFVVGFSPRKRALTIYGIHDGYASTPDPLIESPPSRTTLPSEKVTEVPVPMLRPPGQSTQKFPLTTMVPEALQLRPPAAHFV
jgi:hypothetical protein